MHLHLFVTPDIDELELNFLLFEKSEFVFPDMDALADTGFLIQVVIFTQVALVQYLVHHFTTLAAKMLFRFPDRIVGTGFTAMEALYLLADRFRGRHEYTQ